MLTHVDWPDAGPVKASQLQGLILMFQKAGVGRFGHEREMLFRAISQKTTGREKSEHQQVC